MRRSRCSVARRVLALAFAGGLALPSRADPQAGAPPVDTLRLVTPAGHTGAVTGLEFSPDGRLLVSISADRSARVWEVATGRELRRLWRPGPPMVSAQFTPDGQFVVTASPGALRVWDPATGHVVDSLLSPMLVTAAVSPRGGSPVVATLSADGWVRRFDLRHGLALMDSVSTPAVGAPSVARWTTDGGALVVAAQANGAQADHRAHIVRWTDRGRTRIVALDGHRAPVMSVGVDTGVVATGGADGQIRLWRASDGAPIGTEVANPAAVAWSVALAPNAVIGVGREDGIVRISTRAGQRIADLAVDSATALAVAPSGDLLAVGSKDGHIETWSLTSRRRVQFLGGQTLRLTRLAVSSSGLRAAAVDASGRIRVWETATGHPTRVLSGHEGYVKLVAFAPASGGQPTLESDTLLLTGGDDNTVRVWNLRRGGSREYDVNGKVRGAAFAPDGQRFAVVTDSMTASIWRLGERQPALTVRFDSGLEAVSWLSVDTIVVGDARGRVWIVGVNGRGLVDARAGGTIVDSLSAMRAGVAALAANAATATRVVVAYMNGVVHVIQLAPTVTRVAEFRVAALPRAVILADARGEGAFVAAGPMLYRWRASEPAALDSVPAHEGDVAAVASLPGGRAIMTASQDGSTRIWRTADMRLRLTRVELDSSDWVAVAPDGRFDGSEGGIRRMHYAQGLESIPLEALYQHYLTPGLSGLVLAGEGSAGARLLGVRRRPVLTVRYLAEDARVRVEADAAPDDWSVRLYQNGALVRGSDFRYARRADRSGVRCGARPLCWDFPVRTVPGTNVFEAVAIAASDSLESERSRIIVEGPRSKPNARLVILGVGVGGYASVDSLRYAANDVRQAALALIAGGDAIFTSTIVDTLFDARATRRDILDAFARLRRAARPEDVFVFIYAGHGVVDSASGEFYIAPVDVAALSGASLRRTGIGARRLQAAFDSISALKRVMIMDACHSGAMLARGVRLAGRARAAAIDSAWLADTGRLVPLVAPPRVQAEERAIAQLARSAGVYTLASTDSLQVAVELEPLRHGVFMYSVLAALGAVPADTSAPAPPRVRTVGGVISEVELEIAELSRTYDVFAQYPRKIAVGADFPLVVR